MLKPIKIGFEEDIVHMPLLDYRCSDIINDILAQYKLHINNVFYLDDNFDKFYEAINAPMISIGGYADFTQCDFRDKNSNQDECIVRMESFDFDMDIGDSGILSVTCSKESIQDKSFKDATLYWDCC